MQTPPSAPPLGRLPTFEELAQSPDDAIDVALGAVLVAKDVDERVDVAELLARLDDLASPLRDGSLDGLSVSDQAERVSEHFRDLGFRGNVEDYYDPKNSLLPDVLERRLGIPITLTLVWCEIARRAGVRACGVGFPGHFLARVDGDAKSDARSDGNGDGAHVAAGTRRPVIVDPFAGGRVVEDADAKELLRRALGDGAALHPSLFAAASPRATLVRLLTNLKAIWASRGDHARAFVAIDRIVTLLPDSARTLRERAGIALRLGINDLARADLARVVELEPEAPDIPLIRKRLSELATATRTFN